MQLPRVWYAFTKAQETFFTDHLWAPWKQAMTQRNAARPVTEGAAAEAAPAAAAAASRDTSVFLNTVTMVLYVGGVPVNESDIIQGKRLGKEPGEPWAVDAAPDA
jgi:hypothetical protein